MIPNVTLCSCACALRFASETKTLGRFGFASLIRIKIATVIVLTALSLAGSPAWALVVSIGHRGASAFAPENTIAAVTAAVGNAWGVECDPRITSDGQFIMMHDTTVDRTTDGTGYVANMTFDEIRSLDAGSWFSSAFTGEQVPTLDEELVAATSNGLVACLDIKSGTASQYLPYIQPYKSQIEIHCFTWSFLENLEALESGYTLVALGQNSLLSQVASLPACVDKVSWAYSGITKAGVDAAHAAGKQVYAWTVDSSSIMLSLEAMGVDGIVTNNPALAQAVLNQTPPEPPVLGEGLPHKLRDGLTMNWSFDDAVAGGSPTIAVDSANGENAVLGADMAVPACWQAEPNAKMGGALKFDGSNDYASIPIDAEVMPTGNAVTLATWVKLDALPSAMDESYGGIYDSSDDTYVLYLDKGNNELRFKVTAGAAARPGIPGAQLDTTQWHQVVGVYDGGAGVARIYLDGNLVDVHADDDSLGSDGLVGNVALQSAFFGCNGASYSGFLHGTIDETAVWNRALGQAEIAYLYNGGNGRAVQASNPIIETVAPVVRYEFEDNLTNQGSGGSAYDGVKINGIYGNLAYETGVNGKDAHLYNPETPYWGDAVSVPITLANSGTIAFWCNPDRFYDYQTLFDNSSNADDWEMWIDSSETLNFRIESDSVTSFDLSSLEDSTDWHHLAVTWFKAGSGVVLNLYVDGILRDVDEGAWVTPGSTFYIGGGNTSNDFANAAYDDFRIYDTMLTTDEIVAMYLHKEVSDLPIIPGDANGDQMVNADDLAILADYWGQSGATWDMGDFNDDGRVDAADAAILAANWGYGVAETTTSVPEPTIFGLVIAAMLAVAVMGRNRNP